VPAVLAQMDRQLVRPRHFNGHRGRHGIGLDGLSGLANGGNMINIHT
jgi:hypothetical protein